MTRRAHDIAAICLLMLSIIVFSIRGFHITKLTRTSNALFFKKRGTSNFDEAFDNLEDSLNRKDPFSMDIDDHFSSDDSKMVPEKKRPVILNMQGKWKVLNRAVLAGIFVAGMGVGVTIDSAINTNPKDLASRDAIDRNAPNPKICATYGSSAMVVDQRVFITFNPFNIYVTQADTKPGCVLRPSNVVPLLQQERKLITNEEVESCKNGYNTWAYIGDINNKPQLNCVFQSDDAQNEFLSNPKVGLGEDIYDKSSSQTITTTTTPAAPSTSTSPNSK